MVAVWVGVGVRVSVGIRVLVGVKVAVGVWVGWSVAVALGIGLEVGEGTVGGCVLVGAGVDILRRGKQEVSRRIVGRRMVSFFMSYPSAHIPDEFCKIGL
jgi:hypothetical protein